MFLPPKGVEDFLAESLQGFFYREAGSGTFR
jgi:hypothetical protein